MPKRLAFVAALWTLSLHAGTVSTAFEATCSQKTSGSATAIESDSLAGSLPTSGAVPLGTICDNAVPGAGVTVSGFATSQPNAYSLEVLLRFSPDTAAPGTYIYDVAGTARVTQSVVLMVLGGTGSGTLQGLIYTPNGNGFGVGSITLNRTFNGQPANQFSFGSPLSFPFTFGVPFQWTLEVEIGMLTSVSSSGTEAFLTSGISLEQIAARDSNGALIPGAYLVEVPEPATWMAVAFGMAGLGLHQWRRGGR